MTWSLRALKVPLLLNTPPPPIWMFVGPDQLAIPALFKVGPLSNLVKPLPLMSMPPLALIVPPPLNVPPVQVSKPATLRSAVTVNVTLGPKLKPPLPMVEVEAMESEPPDTVNTAELVT